MDGVKMTQEDIIIIDKISASEHQVYSLNKLTMCMFQINVHCLNVLHEPGQVYFWDSLKLNYFICVFTFV